MRLASIWKPGAFVCLRLGLLAHQPQSNITRKVVLLELRHQMEVIRIDVQLPAVKTLTCGHLHRENIDGELRLRVPECVANIPKSAVKEIWVSGYKSQSEMLHVSTVAQSGSYVHL
jgi:hypothetical protein